MLTEPPVPPLMELFQGRFLLRPTSSIEGLLTCRLPCQAMLFCMCLDLFGALRRSEEHTSELQSLMRISYAVFCLKQKKYPTATQTNDTPAHPLHIKNGTD